MPNPYGAPEISVNAVDEKLKAEDDFVLLDVREPYELLRAALPDRRVQLAPVSRLAQFQLEGLPIEAQAQDADIIVFCHHGVRSAQVTQWLRQQGWTNVASMAGGIDAWAQVIDASVGRY
ncbi:MAG: rhodanese [Anaerolineales bacterium]|nr:rhodanese [Anaerolineales bacterium]